MAIAQHLQGSSDVSKLKANLKMVALNVNVTLVGENLDLKGLETHVTNVEALVKVNSKEVVRLKDILAIT